MIRFCEKEVFAVKREELPSLQLQNFFSEEQREDIIVVNDGEELYGIITSESVGKEAKGLVQRERVLLNENILDKAASFFRENRGIKWLPVINEKEELVYFCFNDTSPEMVRNMETLRFLRGKKKDQLFLGIDPEVQLIVIKGFNELSFRLFLLLLEKNFPVYILDTGENPIESIWQRFSNAFPYRITMEKILSLGVKEEHICIVGTTEEKILKLGERPMDLGMDFFILSKVGSLYREIEDSCTVSFLKSRKIPAFICHVPYIYELDKVTVLERERVKNREGLDIKPPKDIRKLAMLFRVYGEETCKYLWQREEVVDEEKYFERMLKGKYVKTATEDWRESKIYVIGPCLAQGYGVRFEESLIGLLQEKVDKCCPEKYTVLSMINEMSSPMENILDTIKSIPFSENDVVIFINHYTGMKTMRSLFTTEIDLDLTKIYNDRQDEWFFEETLHTNKRANESIAQRLYEELLLERLQKIQWKSNQAILWEGRLLGPKEEQEIEKYVNEISQKVASLKDRGKAGAIVMNCNPFTLGHQYLIEKALSFVDILYLFIVEEDKSKFTFQDRIEMVRRGIKQYHRVILLPSGKFILSIRTLPTYFSKEKLQHMQIDATEDVEIFAKYIALALNIHIRFAGEEPLDKVTKQYNEAMERVLTRYGIRFMEIPRRKDSRGVISASRVRKLLEENRWEELKSLVPETTYEYLEKHYGQEI